jgi:D-arabinose 1-dehydrogenase-like Zn-dependent alcohol dehydrogenase
VPLFRRITGKVTKVGSKVTEFKVGDRAGVGAQVSSCFDCKMCKNDNVRIFIELMRLAPH